MRKIKGEVMMAGSATSKTAPLLFAHHLSLCIMSVNKNPFCSTQDASAAGLPNPI